MTSALVAGGEPGGRPGRGESEPRSRLGASRRDATRTATADDVLGRLDAVTAAGGLPRAAGLADLVDRASATAVRTGADRIVEMPEPLRDLLPGQGLRRGSTVTVAGSTSLLFAMLAAATQAGCWCAVVGMPSLGMLAAAELGVALDRLAVIPQPGPDWPQVVAALLDSVDVVVVAAPTPVAVVPARRLTARARQRGAVLIAVGGWPMAELAVEANRGVWYGLGQGRGRLRCRQVDIVVRGRGAAERPRRARMWLPVLAGPLPMIGGQAVADPPPPTGKPRFPAAIA
jgi:hypothetical protein